MKLRTIATEGTLGTLGHAALDVAGFVPGVGEAADLSNALWYAEEDRYFEAMLSLISLIPVAGDIIGKGAKYLSKTGKVPAKFFAKYGDDIAKHWPKVKQTLRRSEEWRPHVRKLDDVIEQIRQRRGENETAEPASSSQGIG